MHAWHGVLHPLLANLPCRDCFKPEHLVVAQMHVWHGLIHPLLANLTRLDSTGPSTIKASLAVSVFRFRKIQ